MPVKFVVVESLGVVVVMWQKMKKNCGKVTIRNFITTLKKRFTHSATKRSKTVMEEGGG